VIEQLLLDSRLIYVGSIQAVEITDLESLTLANDHAVPARQSGVVDVQLVTRIAANGERFLIESERLVTQRPRRA
jgi:hypothetical protein